MHRERARPAAAIRRIRGGLPGALASLVALGALGACLPDPDDLRGSAVPAEDAGPGAALDGPRGPAAPDARPGTAADAAPAARPPDVAGPSPDGPASSLPGVPPPLPRPAATAPRCLQYAAAYCARELACDPYALLRSYGSEMRCRERLVLECDAFSGLRGATWPTAACISGYDRVSCSDFAEFAEPVECTAGGQLPDGAPCSSEVQCQGRRCVFTAGETCGRCARRSAAGGACTSDIHCVYGLVCAGNVCVQPGGLGASCDPMARPCRTVHTCRGGVCAPRGGADAPCTTGAECDFFTGFGCNTTMRRCVRFVSSATTCRTLPDGTFEVCSAGGTCDQTTRMCTPAAGDGARCNTADDRGPRCTYPASCSESICRLPAPDRACGAAPNNQAEVLGGPIGDGTMPATSLRKTITTNVEGGAPAPLAITAAYALGPGRNLRYLVAVENRGAEAWCEIRAQTVTLRDRAGAVVATDGIEPGLTGSMGIVGGGRWVNSCVAPGETGFILGIVLAPGMMDLFASTERIDFALRARVPGMPAPARVVPIAYTWSGSRIAVTFRNDGTTAMRFGMFTKYIVGDAAGPLSWNFLDAPMAGFVLAPGQTVVLGALAPFSGTANRLRAFADLAGP